MYYNCARGAHKIPLARQLASRNSRVSHFFITIYEIFIKPRELVADRESREDDAVKSRTLLFLAKTISFYSFLFRCYNVAISAIIPIRTNNHLRTVEIGQVSVLAMRNILCVIKVSRNTRGRVVYDDRGSSPRPVYYNCAHALSFAGLSNRTSSRPAVFVYRKFSILRIHRLDEESER